MADHHIFQTFRNSFGPDVEFINNFSGLYQNDAFDFHNSINSILPDQFVINAENGEAMIEDEDRERKRKAMDLSTPQSTCSYSSPDSGSPKAKRRGRGKKGADKVEEKPREVIHVRAKRGQATDSHSLAERVRRGKINERLRCLQDIVPGCYKTMGMAVMLDEIINYVQSLQNQVEFLSMKLTAASSFYDFNADTDAMERANAFEAIKAENGGLPCAQLAQNFGYYPQTR